jgi:hypothetical protein
MNIGMLGAASIGSALAVRFARGSQHPDGIGSPIPPA